MQLNNSVEKIQDTMPTLVFKTEMKTEYRVGERLQLPNLVETSEANSRLTLRIYAYFPNSSMWCLKNAENVVFEQVGIYKIKFFVYDEDYNYAEKSFILNVR